MGTPASTLADMQASDYALTGDISVQDYPAFSNDGLQAPAMDAPLGVDSSTGEIIPSFSSLDTLQPDASLGLNLYNDGLLPLKNANPTNAALDAAAADYALTGDGSTLPLSSSAPITAIGSKTAAPVASSSPMGASLWASLFGVTSSAILGGAKTGVAGGQTKGGSPTAIKLAPKTATFNPFSVMQTSGTILGVFLLAGIVAIFYMGKE